MTLLARIHGPDDVRKLSREELPQLATEVRQRLIDVVSQTGGHIGAGLGVVELTVALCYSFDSPRDKIVWDVGHQGYPWKVLTGRNERLPTLRQEGGLSGFLRRTESEHDQFGAGHAGTALSAAFGMATARDLKGEDHRVVGIMGDGALTCGLPLEAMNNAGHSGRDFIMVLNDNGMSIAPNVGAINRYLGSIIASPITVRIRERVPVTTGSGIEYCPLLELQHFEALGRTVQSLEVLCHDLPARSRVRGLLGLNFLNRFDVRINFKQGFITLS